MSVLRYRRWVLSTGDLPGWVNSRTGLLTGVSQRLTEGLRSLYPLVKPIILRWLGHSHDGSVTPSTTDLVRSVTHHSS
jgi:hypothetical protein